MKLPNPYEKKYYKKLFIIPAVLLALSTFLVLVYPGIPASVDLKGGLLIVVQSNQSMDAALLKAKLSSAAPDAEFREFSTPAGSGVEIELDLDEKNEAAETALVELHDLEVKLTSEELSATIESERYEKDKTTDNLAKKNEAERLMNETRSSTLSKTAALFTIIGSGRTVPGDAHKAVRAAEEEVDAARTKYREQFMTAINDVSPGASVSFKQIGASLSKFFLDKTRQVVIWSFVICGIVVLLVFRSFVPSVAVICGAVSDIWITAGAMAVFGIPLGLASIAALLMLIGLSLDTDIFLTIRLLKRTEGTPAQRAFDAMKVGFMMNASSIGAFGVLALIATWLRIATYWQIGAVVVIGAVADFVATWCTNAPLVLWWIERKSKK
jgi:preprotein translocase subunit SecF